MKKYTLIIFLSIYLSAYTQENKYYVGLGLNSTYVVGFYNDIPLYSFEVSSLLNKIYTSIGIGTVNQSIEGKSIYGPWDSESYIDYFSISLDLGYNINLGKKFYLSPFVDFKFINSTLNSFTSNIPTDIESRLSSSRIEIGTIMGLKFKKYSFYAKATTKSLGVSILINTEIIPKLSNSYPYIYPRKYYSTPRRYVY